MTGHATTGLYADPWQFLTATTKYLRVTAHSSAASAANIEGVVLNAARDTVIGEFAGQAFEAALDGGVAEMLIPVDEITPNG